MTSIPGSQITAESPAPPTGDHDDESRSERNSRAHSPTLSVPASHLTPALWTALRWVLFPFAVFALWTLISVYHVCAFCQWQRDCRVHLNPGAGFTFGKAQRCSWAASGGFSSISWYCDVGDKRRHGSPDQPTPPAPHRRSASDGLSLPVSSSPNMPGKMPWPLQRSSRRPRHAAGSATALSALAHRFESARGLACDEGLWRFL